jgi:FAD synthetase
MTTGDLPARDSHYIEPLVSDTPLPFPDLCARIHDRIYAFLEKKDVSPRLKSLQELIAEALDKYRYVARRGRGRRGAVPYRC